MEEIWKDITGFNGKYQVSSLSRIRTSQEYIKCYYSKKRMKNKILTQSNRLGYLVVSLNDGKKAKQYSAHRLLAIEFIPNPDNKPFVNHINGVKSDNSLENLEWVTAKENSIHAVRVLKVNTYLKGKYNPQSKTIYQYNIDGGLARTWGSIREAARHGYKQCLVSLCCNGKIKSHKGYIWSIKKLDKSYFSDILIKKDLIKTPIIKMDKFNNIIKKYNSLHEAEKDGHHNGCISRCINNLSKTHHGFYWAKQNIA